MARIIAAVLVTALSVVTLSGCGSTGAMGPGQAGTPYPMSDRGGGGGGGEGGGY